jgi:small subunit ribosomal protein S16
VISIHLRRTGAKKDPHYRVVVADSRDARDGSFIEVLGHYHPRFTPARVTLDLERIKSWIAKGAQPSDTIKSLVRQVESGKLDALPDLPKLDPMPINSIEADEADAVEAAPEEIPEASDESSATEATGGDDSEPSEVSSNAETADFPVPAEAAAAGEDAGEQDAAATENSEPDKA